MTDPQPHGHPDEDAHDPRGRQTPVQHGHDNAMGSRHHHGGRTRRALIGALALTAGFMVAELIGGILSNSLALLADAGHMISDAGALALSLVAMTMATRAHTAQRTFGFHRLEILAAFINATALVVIAIYVGVEAIQRLADPEEVASLSMLIVASAGLGVNLLALSLLRKHRGDSLNVRGAFLHVVGDALGSMGAILAAVVILTTGWMQADSAVSLFIAALILASSWRLLKETTSVLLEQSPRDVDVNEVRRGLEEVPGVRGVHDLHVWTVTSGFDSLSCHATVDAGADTDQMLGDATAMLRERFSIHHVTIQPEVEPPHQNVDLCCYAEHQPEVEAEAARL